VPVDVDQETTQEERRYASKAFIIDGTYR
jgi:hypothetical protein